MKLRVVFNSEPYWIEIVEDVKIKIKPVTKIEQAAARAYAKRRAESLRAESADAQSLGGDITNLPDFTNPDISEAVDELLYAQGLGHQVILEWQGIEDASGGELLVSEDSVNDLMRLPYIGDLFLARAQEHLMQMLSEGNGSAS